MQWTAELDALLNQCVFECGYDFTAAAALLVNRARQLRLVSGDARIVVTSDECQVRWMEINPVVEEDEDEGGDPEGEAEDDAFFRRSFHDDDLYRHPSGSVPATMDEDAPEPVDRAEVVELTEGHDEIRPVERTPDEIVEPLSTVEVPEGCPRLELSLSDADLDALLSSLPSEEHGPHETEADSKSGRHADRPGGSSEMQWVLSFLSNPDEAAHHDAEAKNMLFETGDRSDDDNFQYFLQQLNHANLMSPEKPVANTSTAAAADAQKPRGGDVDTTSDEEEDSDEDWMEARKHIKTAGPSRERVPKVTHTPGHKRRLEPKPNHIDEVLPPAAPLRFPPRSEVIPTEDDANEDSDDNGLEALPRYDPPPSASLPLRMPPPESIRPVNRSNTKLLALSHEIGQQLRKNGEFQFPKRLFRDLETDVNIGVTDEQAPEDDL